MAELVALYGDDGHPTGEVVDRARMRAENLRHAATAVVVRNSDGLVYVHRRTDTKDVYPGRYDFAAGGVLQAGEEPYDSAVREVAEELGVTGVELRPLFEADYADDHTRYHGFCYECSWDGPISWQPEEVAWGEWVTPQRLLELLDERSFMPDTVSCLRPWLDAWR
ncbi:MAG: NUDIX domain-containing protein [Propionicimonas sp.]|uniref:NUDIX hydrolase n=1 Tax=Propionicimonas sp. TaxID=1955623 RepID=UPI002B1F65D3|nr:NUDIX domain-containing protein [Propionicimonas sp.]MEA4945002.1 NUDIX domain-containing protein [Propionicimonas sp.]MEA5054310.1 NUDIX domain-containing protein [Propionicimonas sp.]MEA5119619.1 NUDIX domain-containing protein [Propionicimonas sp.]